MDKIFDCIIIGSGPSGLTAANILSKYNVDFMIIDKGVQLYKRNRNKPSDIVSGIGGGGLYSDGKISFYPSGSNLYKLSSNRLEKSYNKLSEIFGNLSIEIPPFKKEWTEVLKKSDNKTSSQKDYESKVLSQDELYNLGFYLYDQIGKEKFLTKHDVVGIDSIKNVFHIILDDVENKSTKRIKSRNILFCGGKFGASRYPDILEKTDLTFKKFEFGFRIESSYDKFDYKDLKQTDLKLIFENKTNKNIEFRTFCFCRKGYIVHGNFDGINSFNGISNRVDFYKTNFGINMRFTDETEYLKNEDSLTALKKSGKIFRFSIKEFLDKNNEIISSNLQNLYKDLLLTKFPLLSKSDATLIGPSFEYFGYYPVLNKDLKLNANNFWVAGDATGDFRGLIPALLSGIYVAYSFLKKEEKEKDQLYKLIRLKQSPTKKTKTIFTAHSKKFFYAKDVICEFVLKEDCIPLNPFQVFGYFLNDRVDRSLVRTGNNELITRCDELWVFGPIADGVLFEIARAYELKIPIRFFTVGTRLKEFIEITDLSKLVFEPEVYAQIGKENLINFISKYYIEDDSKLQQLKLDFEDAD